MKYPLTLLALLALVSGCVSYGKIIKEEPVKNIPDKKYEKIIALKLLEGEPINPNAGFVYIEPEGKISTDYPREEFVKDTDSLQENEQMSRVYHMGKFIIRDSKGKVRGYYETLPEYRAIIWEQKDDILLQIVIPTGAFGENEVGGGARGGRSGCK
jgi:hypothetical protein